MCVYVGRQVVVVVVVVAAERGRRTTAPQEKSEAADSLKALSGGFAGLMGLICHMRGY